MCMFVVVFCWVVDLLCSCTASIIGSILYVLRVEFKVLRREASQNPSEG